MARAKISAQDTLFVHCRSPSTAALAARTVSNPSALSEKSAGLRHSSLPSELMIMIDASQPCSIVRKKNYARHYSRTIYLYLSSVNFHDIYHDEAVVEKEAEGGRGRDGSLRHHFDDGPAHEVLEVGADVGVVVRVELHGGSSGWRRDEEGESEGEEKQLESFLHADHSS